MVKSRMEKPTVKWMPASCQRRGISNEPDTASPRRHAPPVGAPDDRWERAHPFAGAGCLPSPDEDADKSSRSVRTVEVALG